MTGHGERNVKKDFQMFNVYRPDGPHTQSSWRSKASCPQVLKLGCYRLKNLRTIQGVRFKISAVWFPKLKSFKSSFPDPIRTFCFETSLLQIENMYSFVKYMIISKAHVPYFHDFDCLFFSVLCFELYMFSICNKLVSKLNFLIGSGEEDLKDFRLNKF